MALFDGMDMGDYDDYFWADGPISNKETDEQRLNRLLGEFDLEDIENYVRRKKLEKLKGVIKGKGDR